MMSHPTGWLISCSAWAVGGPGRKESLPLAPQSPPRYSAAQASAVDTGDGRLGEHVDVAQIGLLLIGWVVAFLLGKELQAGFLQWREGRRGE